MSQGSALGKELKTIQVLGFLLSVALKRKPAVENSGREAAGGWQEPQCKSVPVGKRRLCKKKKKLTGPPQSQGWEVRQVFKFTKVGSSLRFIS